MGTGPPCYGEGKLFWAEEWAAQHGIAMSDAVAYADNWSDRALLERVGRAVVVHPRSRLLKLANATRLGRRPTRSTTPTRPSPRRVARAVPLGGRAAPKENAVQRGRSLRYRARRCPIASAPSWLHRIPAPFIRALITSLQADSTGPEPICQPFAR